MTNICFSVNKKPMSAKDKVDNIDITYSFVLGSIKYTNFVIIYLFNDHHNKQSFN